MCSKYFDNNLKCNNQDFFYTFVEWILDMEQMWLGSRKYGHLNI